MLRFFANVSASFLLVAQNPYRVLLDSVYELQDSDGRLIWEMFEELPSLEVRDLNFNRMLTGVV